MPINNPSPPTHWIYLGNVMMNVVPGAQKGDRQTSEGAGRGNLTQRIADDKATIMHT